MDTILNDFIETITKQNQLLDQMVKLAEQKREIIVLGKVQELDKLIQKEGIVVSNLEKLEGARFKLQGEIAKKLGKSPDNLSGDILLVELKNSQYYTIFKEVLERLEYNIAKLKALNEENNELINQSLDYLASLQAVIDGDVAGTYSKQGFKADETSSRPKINIVDKKA